MNLIRVKQVAKKLACSEQQVWKLARTVPEFPKSIKLSPRVTTWSEEAIDKWLLTHTQTTGENHETEHVG